MHVWIARQPIFDRRRQLCAYELLFRSAGSRNFFDGTEGASATTQLIANSVLSIGLEDILCGKKAFLNFDSNLLQGDLHSVLPKEKFVVEVLETVEVNEEILAACKNLREEGYTIALDDFVRRPETEPLTEYAQLIKVDMRATDRSEQSTLLAVYQRRGIALLAEKVETLEEFQWAWNSGYDYFQGYFFARPTLIRGSQIPAVKVTCLDLIREVYRLKVDFDRIESLIEADVSLSYQLLRYVNSALFTCHGEIHSIRNGLARLGEHGIRHWAVLATLPLLAEGKPKELIVLSLVRAHFCDCLAKLAKAGQNGYAYLMGLFSLIDGLIDLPLDEALRRAEVAPAITGALLGTSGTKDRLLQIHRLAVAYETGDWNNVVLPADKLGISLSAIGHAYVVSTAWAHEVLQKCTVARNSGACGDCRTCG